MEAPSRPTEATLVIEEDEGPAPDAPAIIDPDVALPLGAEAEEEPIETDRTETTAATQTIYVNFDGPVIKTCANPCSDATRDETFIIGDYLKKSRVNFAPYTSMVGRRQILGHLRTWFARYDVRFTATRPASGAYTMVVITPSYAPNHGIAPLDCNNQSKSDIAFVFRTAGYSPQLIAQEAAHELGHSFGLAHVKSSADFMQWASSGHAFTRATYDTAHPSGKCFSGTTQNAPALLASSLGLR